MSYLPLSTPQEASERRTAHNNGWDGVNGMVPNTFDTIPLFCSSHYNEPVLLNEGTTSRMWSTVTLRHSDTNTRDVVSRVNTLQHLFHVLFIWKVLHATLVAHQTGTLRSHPLLFTTSFLTPPCVSVSLSLSLSLSHSLCFMVLF